MTNLARLEKELSHIRAELARIERDTGELDDQAIARYCMLEDAAKTTAALLEEERETEREDHAHKSRIRASMDLGREPRPQDSIAQGVAIAAGMTRDYERLFGAPARSDWRPGEFFRCIANNWHDPRLRPLAQMGESGGSAGGLMVPSQLEQRLLDRAIHASIVLSRANITGMTTAQKTVAGFSGTNQSSTLYGFSWAWLAEHAEADVGSGLIRAILLNAHTDGIYVAASNELVSDSGFEAELTARMGDAVAESLDQSFISGDGAGKPLGYLQSGALLVIDKEVGQAPGTIVPENVLAMISHATNLANSVRVGSPSILPAIGTMVINIGMETASSTLLTRSAAGGLELGGRPLLLTHRAPLLGQVGDLALVDFGAYIVGMRQGIGLESSGHGGFTRREQTYRCLVRCDGQPVVMTPHTGADQRQYSPFVSLAIRA